MCASHLYDADGFLRTESVDDRCANFVLKESLLNLNRCVSCAFFDANERRCLNERNRIDPFKEEAPYGKQLYRPRHGTAICE